MSEDSEKKMASARSVARVYWKATMRYPWLFAAAGVSTVLIQFGELATPLYLRNFFNIISANTPSASTYTQLLSVIVAIAVISAIVWVLRRTFGFSMVYFESRIMRDLLDDGFSGLIAHSYSFFISRFAGSLTHKVNKFSRAYETMLDSIMFQFIPTIVFVGGAIIILFLRNPILGVFLGVWTVIFLTFQYTVARMRQPLRVERSERETLTTGALADAIGNHATIQLFSGVRYENELLSGFTQRWYESMTRSWNADEWIWGALGLLMSAIEVGLLWVATILWQKGELTVGDFVLIQAYLLTTFERLIAINRELRRVYDAFADASEMVGLLEERQDVVDAQGATRLTVTSGEVRFNDTSFAFNPSQPILRHLDLTIKPSERVALVGPSGAGKSTITKLLLRLYDLTGGSIEIDGQDISKVTQESLRDAIAFVPQEPILFHRTLRENIRYGRRDATESEIIEAARKAHCHEFIASLPLGYDTFVGERGVKLSGGERQRVAIARAILRDAPILLLDEATSSLDSESESLIQDALKTLMEGKTVIVIAHRLSTIMKMDRILVIERGAVVAQGDHQALLQGGGLYQKLWSIQAGGFLTDEEQEVENTQAEEEEDVDEGKEPEATQVK